MKRTVLALHLITGLAIVGCSGAKTQSGFADSDDGGGGPSTTPTGGQDGSSYVAVGTMDGGIFTAPDAALVGQTPPASDASSGVCTYASTDTTDHDGDGWSNADGDCNDCNKFINPGAYDIPGNGIDEDCSGKVDDEPTGCDSTLSSVATTAGEDGAKAIDLCRTATANAPLPMKTWGVLSATYELPDGKTTPVAAPLSYQAESFCSFDSTNFGLGFGLLPKFGTSNTTQQGSRMLALSSGTARNPTDPGYQDVGGFDKCFTNGAPTGFPGQTPACGNVNFGTPHDGAALSVSIRVPTNALTMSFDSNFFSYEFPEWVCSVYNDTYVVIMTPQPQGEPASANGNIAFDSMANIVSINAGLLNVCEPTTKAGAEGTGTNKGKYTYACTEGPSKLLGTGFGSDTGKGSENHASTDWLTTTVSVANLAGQEITLLFGVWDSTDGQLDTTVLVDNVHWTFATAPDTDPPPPTTPMTTPAVPK
jgi:hypothetical protein